ATLASAFIISNYVDKNASLISFQTVSGRLGVTCSDGLYELDFPARPAVPIAVTPEMSLAIGAPVLEAYKARDYMFVVESDTVVRDLVPDFAVMRLFEDCLGVIVTAEAASGSQADFVSRFFVPIAGIPEDAVTGSSHCTLIPFWSERLNKQKMLARQLSLRGGELHCENRGARVLIGGGAVLYMQGEILL
ncbi:MAG: PhzF family phenazine biosynthesis protein, partial [Coriobacteriia bacterium]|nr:PhzF family phenazine biosynthesis protein [Coriobacteriia bacterium]